MKTHIVVYGAYYYAELVGSTTSYWDSAKSILQYRTRVGDLFILNEHVNTFPTRLEAYRYMFFNIRDLTKHWRHRRICYPYPKLTRIMRKLYPEDFI